MKFKSLIATLVLGSAALANTAQAAIESGATAGANNAGGSELFFAAFDGTNTYVRDLGIGFNDINSASTYSFSADADLLSIMGGSAFQWTVLGVDANAGATPGTTDISKWGFRLLATSTSGNPVIDNALATDRKNTLNNAVALANDFAVANSTIQGGSVADNLANLTTNPADPNAWGNFLSGGIGGTDGVVAGLGDSMDFFLYNSTGAFLVPGQVYNPLDVSSEFLGTWTLAANGDLSFGDNAVIPVPAAVWLFGSALVGLVGAGRRKAA